MGQITEALRFLLNKLQTEKLYNGAGNCTSNEMCVMEWTDALCRAKEGENEKGEGADVPIYLNVTANPTCSDRVLADFAIETNDEYGSENREKLKSLIPFLMHTYIDPTHPDHRAVAREREWILTYGLEEAVNEYGASVMGEYDEETDEGWNPNWMGSGELNINECFRIRYDQLVKAIKAGPHGDMCFFGLK